MPNKQKIILQIGSENWSQSYKIPENINWKFISENELLSYVENQKKIKKDKRKSKKSETISAMVITDDKFQFNLMLLESLVDVHSVFYPIEIESIIKENSKMKHFLKNKMARPFSMNNIDYFINQLSKGLFEGQYGAKLSPVDLQVSQQFDGEVTFDGSNFLRCKGHFGDHFNSLVTHPYNIQYDNDKFLDIFFEFSASKAAEIKINLCLIPSGSTDTIAEEWIIEGDQLKQPYTISSDISGVLSIQVLAKGEGEIEFGPLHYRWSRNGLGEFLLGGERYSDEEMNEFMYYFDPVDFKPPLCVYFSGFRSAEGFEGYWMMKSMKTPFLLICDPRLEGGSFYIGSDSYESKIISVINEKLDFLGFSPDQLILSGLSMGTYGAVYYGASLNPHGIIIGKPVLNLGQVAQREKTDRPGGFPTSLDIQLKYYDDLSKSSSDLMDLRMWKKVRSGKFNNTTIIVAYMKDDDYDGSGFSDLLENLDVKEVKIFGKGWPGRHGDGAVEVPSWFLLQYQGMLINDFNRKLE